MSPVESPSCADPNLDLVRARMRATESHGLGVFTFPWRRVTDTHEELPLPIFDPKVEAWRRGLRKSRIGSDRTDGWQKGRLTLEMAVGPLELPSDFQATIHAPNPSRLSLRHYLE
ncbi:hypothetical protein CRG98_005070 [Punica granatum]|uniref:Uncharacterized protein n=1 Tax=Punica granatum TaxID=22663 RepID=A0A2I0L1E0_PUNGR|nr:hypothetical protein CRG98_005070 [Punica granatum]